MLFGRKRESSRIDALIGEIRRGASGVLVVTGEPGIGKSSLLRYALDNAGGLHVLSVAGAEPEIVLAFAALGRLLSPVLRYLPAVPDEQAAALRGALCLEGGTSGDRFAVYAATLSLIGAAAERRPVLMVVDDAQWLDQPTAEALAFVARRLQAEGVGLLLASREQRAFDEFETIQLPGLDETAARELLASGLDAPPAPGVVHGLTAGLAGNPLALQEVAASLTRQELTGQRPLPPNLPAIRTAERVFGPRLASLDAQTRGALSVVAVAAVDGLPVVLAALAAAGQQVSALERLEEQGLLSLLDGNIRFTHPLLRTAALGVLSPAGHRRLHRLVAGLCVGPQDVERRAWHLAEACPGPDEEAAQGLQEAGELARSRSGYAAAAHALERAARLSTTSQAAADRCFAAADAAWLAGQRDLVMRLLDRTEQYSSDPISLARVAGLRGSVQFRTGRVEAARQTWQTATAAVAEANPAEAAPLLADSSWAAFAAGDPAAALEYARRAAAAAAPDDHRTQLKARFGLGLALNVSGAAHHGVTALAEIADLVGPGTDPVDPELVVIAALGLAWAGESALARTLLAPTLHQLRVSGSLGYLPFALAASADVDLKAGQLADAATAASESADLAMVTGDVVSRVSALACLASVAAQRGDEQACRQHAAEALQLRASADQHIGRDALDALGLLELSLGRPAAAIPWLEQVNQLRAVPGNVPVLGRPSAVDLIEAYVRTGQHVPTSLRDQLNLFTQREDPPALVALAWRAQALLADDAHFDDCFSRALARHHEAQTAFSAARTQLCYGERLRRAGRRRDARAQLTSAYSTFHMTGAKLWATRASAELAAAGQPVSAATEPAADATEALTPQERQVAGLAASGASNRDIAGHLVLSVKTIEMHLGRVYRKLGVRSRTQLANLQMSGSVKVDTRYVPSAPR